MSGAPWYACHLKQMGYAFPCAHCIHLADSVFRLKGDSCNVSSCGGPIAGKSFPKFKSTVPRVIVIDKCFVCGEDAMYSAEAKDGGKIGVCENHKQFALSYCKIKKKDKRVLAGVLAK